MKYPRKKHAQNLYAQHVPKTKITTKKKERKRAKEHINRKIDKHMFRIDCVVRQTKSTTLDTLTSLVTTTKHMRMQHHIQGNIVDESVGHDKDRKQVWKRNSK